MDTVHIKGCNQQENDKPKNIKNYVNILYTRDRLFD